MKTVNFIGGILGIMALAISLYLFTTVGELQNELNLLNQELAKAQNTPQTEEVELVGAMGKLQYFMDKLWFSSKGNNWGLAAFYAHEIEETLEELEQPELMHDEIAIAPLVQQMIMPTFEQLEGSIKTKNSADFDTKYAQLITSCNACHQVVGKPYLVIKTPTQPRVSNQQFEWIQQ